jgi:D-serine deaminase-like pyridoxal phosphate-dependent protein
MIDHAHERVRAMYGSVIGRKRNELVTPALILDLELMRQNLAFMAERMKNMPAKLCAAKLRAHIKVHKSPDIARMQIEAGAIGVGTGTLWEAIVMARADIKDVFLINEVVDSEKLQAAALLAREVPLKVAVDEISNAEVLSEAVRRAGSEIGCMIEVDTEGDTVVDIWPIIPRGPEHGGLLNAFKDR